MKKKTRVILPGSYDPVTVGHLEVIKRAASEYEEVFVVIFINPKKQYMFSLEDRLRMLSVATDGLDNVLVSYSTGYVIDYMREHEIELIVKGYRTEADLPWEHEQARWNKEHGGYDTVLWRCDESLAHISSTYVREALVSGDTDTAMALLPSGVYEYIRSRDGLN